MNEQRNDFELLRDFVRRGNQAAFASVVRRHIDLVYATALRKLEDHGAAEEVAQNVFEILARKAWQFAADDSLAAWLYRTTLLEAKEWLRGELRRRRRELTAAELGTTMKTPDDQTAFRALLPLLDEALLSLRDADRTALLLRFYESQSLRDVGTSLGVSEDTAQKRVAGALEKISRFFQRRGFRTASVATATAALQHTATSAPAATTAMIAGAASKCAPAGFGLSIVARLASLSKGQTAAACVAIALVPLAWQVQQVRSVNKDIEVVEQQLESARNQYTQASAESERLRAEETELSAAVASKSQTEARTAEATRKLQDLKSLIQAGDYRWQDDSPFARIPKSALPAIIAGRGGDSPEHLQAKIRELFNLNPQEQQAADQVFSNYFAAIDHLVGTSVTETNDAPDLHLPVGAESKIFVLQPIGAGLSNALDELYADLTVALGSDRWTLLNPNKADIARAEQVRLVGYSAYALTQPQMAAVNIFTPAGAPPTVSLTGSGGVGMGAMPLALFVPSSADPASGFHSSPFPQQMFPKPLEMRLRQWLSEQAAARLPQSVRR